MAAVGAFQSWRFEGAKPGEGDMTFEDGGGFVSSRPREEESLAPVGRRAIKVGACDVAYVEGARVYEIGCVLVVVVRVAVGSSVWRECGKWTLACVVERVEAVCLEGARARDAVARSLPPTRRDAKGLLVAGLDQASNMAQARIDEAKLHVRHRDW